MKKELENLTESDEKVRELLASLKQVEAPQDFEFRLKARIARANPNAYQTNYKRHFAYALPAFASVIVSTFVVLNGNFFGGAGEVNPIAETQAQQPPPAVNITQPQKFTNASIASDSSDRKAEEKILVANSGSQIERSGSSGEPSSIAIGKRNEKPKNEKLKVLIKENDGFSQDKTQLGSTKVFRPRGLNPDAKVEPPKDFNSEKSFSAQELLSPLGVEVVGENGKWKVKNVSPNSAAERSGLKTDDVIETLDGQKLSGTPLRGKKIEVKKLGVKRGGAQIEINLQTNPK
ncbi:MAG TPA: PDZ domain-containing protein [Pyrinomonadaceae bacterium]|jgi:membrane-associated protease RseP (regulator of RpoE activity)